MTVRTPKGAARPRADGATARSEPVSPRFEPRHGASGTVARTDIVQQCTSVPGGHIVLLEAPAGYGKTAVFAQWYAAVRTEGRHVIWITLRESERAWPALAEALGAAIQRTPLVKQKGAIHLASHAGDDIRRFTDAVTDAIQRFGKPVVLLMDGYESAESPSSNAFLDELFEQLPMNLVVGISSRHRLQIPVSRWLLQGRLSRLDKRALLFSKADIRTFFGSSLSPAELHRLHALTEGWPAAVKFAQICLDDSRTQQIALDVLPSYSRLVGDFCMTEVLKGVDAESTSLLMLASVFETIEPDLCDAVTQRQDSSGRIAQIASRETFLDHAESGANIWRLPKLLRQTLVTRALTYGPTPLPMIHLRAAEQFEARGMTLEAVRHYVAAGDAHRAALAFERASPMGIAARWGDDRAAAILDLIPAHCLAQYPRIAICRVYLDYKSGLMDEARHFLERIGERTSDFTIDRDGGDDSRFQVEAAVCTLEMEIYGIANVTTEHVQATERRITQIVQTDARFASFAHCMGGIVCCIRGDLDTARTHFIQSEKLLAQSPGAWMELWLKYHRGSLALAHGQMMEAKYHLQAALKQWRRDFPAYKTFGPAVSLLLAELDYESEALEEAQAKIDEAIFTVENTEGWYEHYCSVYELAMMTMLHAGRPHDAEGLLERVGAIKRVSRVLHDFLPILRLRLVALQGSAGSAANGEALRDLHDRWMRPNSHDEFSWRAWDLAGVCLAESALQTGDLAGAAQVLQVLERDVRRQRRDRSLVKALALRAVLHYRKRETQLAIAQILQALEIANTQGYRRTLLDEGAIIRPVLDLVVHEARAAVPARCAAFAEKLIDALDAQAQEFAPATIRLLSDRESDVIQELSLGRSNKAIGRKLTLSESTVKFHIKNIFRKLGVRRRLAAVAEAKRRGLVH